MVITIEDNGTGMTAEVLSRDFWGLGFSPSRDRPETIGEKGHGTKIYLRSEQVVVRTQTDEAAFESKCEWPLRALARRRIHTPKLRSIPKYREGPGTKVAIIGYNDNERSQFVQDIVTDYILWFTKVGSIGRVFGVDKHVNFRLFLKCLDRSDFEEIGFGHPFPKEDDDIQALFDSKGTSAADWYVKQYTWTGKRLRGHPEVTFDAVISVEGDAAKRAYNPMIRERRRSDTGRYRVRDRYGIWLCKDYIPIVRVNEWISGFGSGSNAFVLLHGFVNCQSLKLTANRGTIANTDPKILEELKDAVQDLVESVDVELDNQGLYTLKEWQEEHRTIEQEKSEYQRRIRGVKSRRVAIYQERLLPEPQNESELFGLFITMNTLNPELFDFEPLDYNTSRGIDIIARPRSGSGPNETQYAYVELKYALRTDFNHSFKHIRWIVCWDFDRGVAEGTEFYGVEEKDVRRLQFGTDEANYPVYFLDNRGRAHKIQVIRLKELLETRLGIRFDLRTQVPA